MSANLSRNILLSVFILCFLIGNPASPSPDITKAPHVVMVLSTNSKYFCSGAIVDPKWALTAAHCLHDLDGVLTESDDSVLVVAGTNRLSQAKQDIKSGKAQIQRSKKLVVHHKYSWRQRFVNDVALVELSEAFNLTTRVAVVGINKTTDKPMQLVVSEHKGGEEVSWRCSVYGYGRQAGSDERAVLKATDLTVNKHCHCLEWIRSYKSPVDILRHRNGFVCEKAQGTGLCAGDNGSPLICEGALRGLVTSVFHYRPTPECKMVDAPDKVECGDSRSLNLFTDLCYFNDWLRSSLPNLPQLDETCNDVNQTSHTL